jgi:hypothetical protein
VIYSPGSGRKYILLGADRNKYGLGSSGGSLKAFDQLNRAWWRLNIELIRSERRVVIHHGVEKVIGRLKQLAGDTFTYDVGKDIGTDVLCWKKFPPRTTTPPGPGNVRDSTGQSQMGQASGSRQ